MQTLEALCVFTCRTSPPACCFWCDSANCHTHQNSGRCTHLSQCLTASLSGKNSVTSEPITAQPCSHVSAADKLCMHEEDLCVTVCMNGSVYLLHVHILGLLCISVSNSSSVPEKLPALYHSRGLKQPHTHTHTNTCMSLHNYTCTGTSNPPPPLPQCLLFIMHHELTPPVGSEEVETRRSLFKEASLKVARSEGKRSRIRLPENQR